MARTEITYTPEKLDEVLEKVFKIALDKGPSRVLWICPTGRLLRDRTARFARFVERLGLKGSLLPSMKTLNQLAIESYLFKNPSHEFIGDERQIWIADEAIFKVFNKNISGLSVEALTLISNLKQYISPDLDEVQRKVFEALEDWFGTFTPSLDAGVYERIRFRVENLLKIFTQYEKIKNERRLFDVADAYNLSEPQFFEREIVVLDSFQDFYPAQLTFLKKLEEKIGDVVVLKLDFQVPQGELFDLSYRQQSLAVSFRSYTTPASEIEDVALQAASLIRYGVPPEEILIIVPELSLSARALKTALESKGLAVNISIGYELSRSAAGGFLKSVLNFLKDPALSKSFLDVLLSFSFLSISSKNPAFENSLRQLLIKEGFYDGSNYLTRAIEYFQNCSEAKALLEKIEELKNSEKMGEALQKIEELVQMLYEFLSDGSFEDKDFELIMEGLNSYRQSYLYDVEREKPVDFERIASVISSVLFKPSRAFSGDVAEGVQATGILESRGIASDFVFLVGFTDRAFPGRPLKTYILPEGVKERLGIPTSDEYLSKQKADFYRLIQSARYGVFISSYEQEKNEVLMESRFITELKAILEGAKTEGVFVVETEKMLKERPAFVSAPASENGSTHVSKTAEREVVVTVDQVKKILTCEIMFLLKLKNYQPLSVPEEFPNERMLGNIFHKLASDFVSAFKQDELIGEDKMLDWYEHWWSKNIEAGYQQAHILLDYFGEKRIFDTGLALLFRLSSYRAKGEILVPEKEMGNYKKTIYEEKSGKKIVLSGRPDLILFDESGNLNRIVDFKVRETKKNERYEEDENAFQVFLYQFLLSESSIDDFVPAGPSEIVKVHLFERSVEPSLISIEDMNREEFKMALKRSVEIVLSGGLPDVKECSQSICYLSQYCPVR